MGPYRWRRVVAQPVNMIAYRRSRSPHVRPTKRRWDAILSDRRWGEGVSTMPGHGIKSGGGSTMVLERGEALTTGRFFQDGLKDANFSGRGG